MAARMQIIERGSLSSITSGVTWPTGAPELSHLGSSGRQFWYWRIS
jgi:hypothetical protein